MRIEYTPYADLCRLLYLVVVDSCPRGGYLVTHGVKIYICIQISVLWMIICKNVVRHISLRIGCGSKIYIYIYN